MPNGKQTECARYYTLLIWVSSILLAYESQAIEHRDEGAAEQPMGTAGLI